MTTVDTRSGAPSSTSIDTSSPAPVTQDTKGTTGVDLAIQLGVRLADLASGKGLHKATNPDGSINAADAAQNTEIQKAQSGDVTGDYNALVAEIKQAFVVIANPTLKPADDVAAAKGLVSALAQVALKGQAPQNNPPGTAAAPGEQLNGTGAVTAAGTPHEYNAFLSGIVTVALLEAMMDFMKSQEVGEKIASVQYLQTKAVTEDCTNAIVTNIEEKAKAEAISDIIKAACSAGAMCASLVGGIGGMTAKTTAQSQAINMLSRAAETFFTGFLQNMADAPLTIVKGDLDAQKTILDMVKQFMDTLMQNESQQYNDYSKNFDSFNEALNQWLQTLSRIGNKLTSHG